MPGFRLRLWRRHWRWWSPFIHGARRKCRNWRRLCRSMSRPRPRQHRRSRQSLERRTSRCRRSLQNPLLKTTNLPRVAGRRRSWCNSPLLQPHLRLNRAQARPQLGKAKRFCRLRLSQHRSRRPQHNFSPSRLLPPGSRNGSKRPAHTRPAPTPRRFHTRA